MNVQRVRWHWVERVYRSMRSTRICLIAASDENREGTWPVMVIDRAAIRAAATIGGGAGRALEWRMASPAPAG